MAFASLKFPPGIFKNGTRLQARGRWFDGSLVRWFGDAMQPVGAWEELTFTSPDLASVSSGETGFGDTTAGQAPSGFTEVQIDGSTGESAQDWRAVVEAQSEYGGQFLQLPDRNNTYGGYFVWTGGAQFADGDVLALVRIPDNADGTQIGVAMRATAVDPVDGIVAAITPFGGETNFSLKLAYDDNHTGGGPGSTDILTDSNFASNIQGELWWIRMNISGTAVKVRTWQFGTSEPGTWNIDTTLPGGAPTAAGYAAIVAGTPTDLREMNVDALSYSADPSTPAVAPDTGTGATSTTTGVEGIGGPVHGMLAWRDNDNVGWLAAGTPDKCFVFSEGLLRDVTPGGFTAGRTDASSQVEGYGTGAYGAGVYGTGVSSSVSTTLEAQSWQMDNFGELLIALAHSDGVLYSFTPNVDSELQVITGDASLPTDNTGVVVTPERFLVALGADGDPRKIKWADQESLSVWAPTTENQAGDFTLSGTGAILAGARSRGETLIWTTQDLFSMQFIGGLLVYSIQQVGSNSGLIGRRAHAMVDGGRALWMGVNSFFLYDGAVRPLPSEVSDYVFSDINREQASKIFTMVWPEFDEVWWFYPSDGETDIDRYVAYNYNENHWSIGDLNRTAGAPRGVFQFPVMADKDGTLYFHEKGTTYLDTDGETALVPFAESGPFLIAEGDQTMWVREIIPDENTLGDVQAVLKSRLYPTATESSFGPFTLSNPTSVRLSGRQVALRVEQVNPDWRVGVPRLDIVPAGRR